MKNVVVTWLCLLFIIACGPVEKKAGSQSQDTGVTPPKERPLAVDHNKIFEKEGKKYLWGGKEESTHFDISDCSLKDEQFHYGIGRERFPALLEPEFITVEDADSNWIEEDRFLILDFEGIVKAYSIKDLTRHEVVNDEVNGIPIMAAYCILADLGAIYERTISDRPYTFALSGYTYFDPNVWDGMDGFVFWDRETESLWWPLVGEAVSGPMKGTKMKVLDERHWVQSNWAEVKTKYPNALVLKSDQDFERPAEWVRYTDVSGPPPEEANQKAIAPKWGENGKGKSSD